MRNMNASQNQFSPGSPASQTHIPISVSLPRLLLADDATSADQLALSVCETLGKRVITTDTRSLTQRALPVDEPCMWVINSETRALSEENARAQNHYLATRIFPREKHIPLVQIDSRFRGIRNALKGLYESLDFEFLLFVPAEPELGRVVQNGIYYHVEDGRPTPFHQSVLARSAQPPFDTSDLRALIAAALGVSTEQIVSINEEAVSSGPNAVVECIRGIKKQERTILIPDIARPAHVESVIAAWKTLSRNRVLLAGSRTFLRSLFASFALRQPVTHQTTLLSQAIARTKNGAPLAVIASSEPSTSTQIDYAQRALGPNLVTVVFDPGGILANERIAQRETDRVQQLLQESLKAMRPVLLRASSLQVAGDPIVRERHLYALAKVVAQDTIHRRMTSLFVSGGQTAEMVRATLGISAVEIKGAFQEGIPLGLPIKGSFHQIPIVTKGGRLGKENVLFEFFEQGHPLPRANIVPVVTPLTKDREVDQEGIERLINHLVCLGTTDIFAVGNAGEFRFLTNEQRLRALALFAKQAQGRLRVFAGITADTAAETRNNYQAAGRLGVYAAVAMPLYFLERSADILPFIESLASINSGLPVILYNNPERTRGQNISFEVVEALEFPVMAIKDSSGDLNRFDRYVESIAVYEGQQRQFLEGYLHGARGAVGIIGHVSPLPNEFFDPATVASRREAIARQINDLSKTVKEGGAEVAAYKYVLSLMGVLGDTVASNEPARDLTAAQREQIRITNAELISQMRGLSSRAPNRN